MDTNAFVSTSAYMYGLSDSKKKRTVPRGLKRVRMEGGSAARTPAMHGGTLTDEMVDAMLLKITP